MVVVAPLKVPKVLRRFESIDGTLAWRAPILSYEWESSQALTTPTASAHGADYSYDMLGTGLSNLLSGVERIRFSIFVCDPMTIDEAFGEVRSILYRIGLGKGYTYDAEGNQRWAYMRMASMPTYQVLALDTPASQKLLTVVAEFRRDSPWFGALVTQVFTLTEANESFNVLNAGEGRVYNAVFILKGTFPGPTLIHNVTNDYDMETERAGAAASDWLRFDAGRNAVEFSADSGATWTPDYLNFLRRPGQVQLMILEPVTNAFEISFEGGAASGTFEVSFYPQFYS